MAAAYAVAYRAPGPPGERDLVTLMLTCAPLPPHAALEVLRAAAPAECNCEAAAFFVGQDARIFQAGALWLGAGAGLARAAGFSGAEARRRLIGGKVADVIVIFRVFNGAECVVDEARPLSKAEFEKLSKALSDLANRA